MAKKSKIEKEHKLLRAAALASIYQGEAGQHMKEPDLLQAFSIFRQGQPEVALAVFRLFDQGFQSESTKRWHGVALSEAGRHEEALQILGGVQGMERAGSMQPRLSVLRSLFSLGRSDELEHALGVAAEADWGRERVFSLAGRTSLERLYADQVDQAGRFGPKDILYYYHLPFAGGTSIQSSVADSFPRAERINVQRRRGAATLAELDQRPDAWSGGRFLHQHHPFPLEFPNELQVRGFTILREPVSRFLSGVFKHFTKGIMPMRAVHDGLLSLEDLEGSDSADELERVVRTAVDAGLTNMVTREYAAMHPRFLPAFRERFSGQGAARATHEEDLFYLQVTKDLPEGDLLNLAQEVLDKKFAVVGSMKHFEASYLAGLAACGIPFAGRLKRIGQSHRRPVPDKVTSILREANLVDAKLFEHYHARFEEEHAAMIQAVREDTSASSPS